MGIDPVDAQGGPFPRPKVSTLRYARTHESYLGALNRRGTLNGSCEGHSVRYLRDNNFQQYYLHAEGPAVEIEVLGANHMSFLDDINCGSACSVCPRGSDDPLTTRRLTQSYLTAFLKVIIEGDNRYRVYLTDNAMPLGLPEDLAERVHKNGF